MNRSIRLLFGPGSAVLFFVGMLGIALAIPGYSHVHQTVSEIGALGTPTRWPFTLMILGVAACLLVFAWGVRGASLAAGKNTSAAWLIGCMVISCAGIAFFATPHPLHNDFGLSELVGYQAPLALALAWKSDPKARALVLWSWLLYAALWIAIGLNLSMMFPGSWLATEVMPVYGLVQRSLFLAWFAWCTVTGILMWRRSRTTG